MKPSAIVWREGMFMAPQHFQQNDAWVQRQLGEISRFALFGDDFGLSRLELDHSLLAIGKLGVMDAAGLFPDRSFFELTQTLVMDIPDGVVGTTAVLALPLQNPGVQQTGETRGLHRWLTRSVELEDLNDPETAPLEIEVAAPGVCLKLDREDLSGYACIPFARVLEKTAEGRVVLDENFIPTCIAVGASERLHSRLAEILSLARARANNAAQRLTAGAGTQTGSSLINERFELDLLNQAIVELQAAAQYPWLSPRQLFILMARLLAGMEAQAARVIDADVVFAAREPTVAFQQLIGRLRTALTLERRSSVVALAWNTELFEKRRLLRLVVPASLLRERRRPVLAVTSPDYSLELLSLVPQACKLAGLSAMPGLVTHGLAGIPLTPLSVPPAELRDRPDTAFFTIDTTSSMWAQVVDHQEALALHVDERIDRLSLMLYLMG